MRAVSTVLDVTVFLLLVSVALVTLAVPAADPPASTADETVEALAATTANVTYSPDGPGDGSLAPTRSVAGTHAELLARGAVANVRLENEPLAPTAGGFRASVREEAAAALAWSHDRTGVLATWEPYPDAPLRGEFAVGNRPPPGVDVGTATATVPVPIEDAGPPARAAAGDGYRGVSRAIVDAVFRTTLGTDRPVSPRPAGDAGRDRQRRMGAYAAAVSVDEPTDGRDGALSEIERRFVDRLAADLRERYDSPAAAAADVDTGRVRLVVREWSS